MTTKEDVTRVTRSRSQRNLQGVSQMQSQMHSKSQLQSQTQSKSQMHLRSNLRGGSNKKLNPKKASVRTQSKASLKGGLSVAGSGANLKGGSKKLNPKKASVRTQSTMQLRSKATAPTGVEQMHLQSKASLKGGLSVAGSGGDLLVHKVAERPAKEERSCGNDKPMSMTCTTGGKTTYANAVRLVDGASRDYNSGEPGAKPTDYMAVGLEVKHTPGVSSKGAQGNQVGSFEVLTNMLAKMEERNQARSAEMQEFNQAMLVKISQIEERSQAFAQQVEALNQKFDHRDNELKAHVDDIKRDLELKVQSLRDEFKVSVEDRQQSDGPPAKKRRIDEPNVGESTMHGTQLSTNNSLLSQTPLALALGQAVGQAANKGLVAEIRQLVLDVATPSPGHRAPPPTMAGTQSAHSGTHSNLAPDENQVAMKILETRGDQPCCLLKSREERLSEEGQISRDLTHAPGDTTPTPEPPSVAHQQCTGESQKGTSVSTPEPEVIYQSARTGFQLRNRGPGVVYNQVDETKFGGDAAAALSYLIGLDVDNEYLHNRQLQNDVRFFECNVHGCKYKAKYDLRNDCLYASVTKHNSDAHEQKRSGRGYGILREIVKDGDSRSPLLFDSEDKAKEYLESLHGALLAPRKRQGHSIFFKCLTNYPGCAYNPKYCSRTKLLHDDPRGHNSSDHESREILDKRLDMMDNVKGRAKKLAETKSWMAVIPVLRKEFSDIVFSEEEIQELKNFITNCRKSRTEGTIMASLADVEEWVVKNDNQSVFKKLADWMSRFTTRNVNNAESVNIEDILLCPHRFTKKKNLGTLITEVLQLMRLHVCAVYTENSQIVYVDTTIACLLNVYRAVNAPGQPMAVFAADQAHGIHSGLNYMPLYTTDGAHHGHLIGHAFCSQESIWSYRVLTRKLLNFALEVLNIFNVTFEHTAARKLKSVRCFEGILCDGDLSIGRGVSEALIELEQQWFPFAPMISSNRHPIPQGDQTCSLYWLRTIDRQLFHKHVINDSNQGMKDMLLRFDCQVHIKRSIEKSDDYGHSKSQTELMVAMFELAAQACSLSTSLKVFSWMKLIANKLKIANKDHSMSKALTKFLEQYGPKSNRAFWMSSIRPPGVPRDTNIVESGIKSFRQHLSKNFASNAPLVDRTGRAEGAINALENFAEFHSEKSLDSKDRRPWTCLDAAIHDKTQETLRKEAREFVRRYRQGAKTRIYHTHPEFIGVYLTGLPNTFFEQERFYKSFFSSKLVFQVIQGVYVGTESKGTSNHFPYDVLGLREYAQKREPPFYFGEEKVPLSSILLTWERKMAKDTDKSVLKFAQDIFGNGEMLEVSALVIVLARWIIRLVVKPPRWANLVQFSRTFRDQTSGYACSCVGYVKHASCKHVLELSELSLVPSQRAIGDFMASAPRHEALPETEIRFVYSMTDRPIRLKGLEKQHDSKSKFSASQYNRKYWAQLTQTIQSILSGIVAVTICPGESDNSELLQWDRSVQPPPFQMEYTIGNSRSKRSRLEQVTRQGLLQVDYHKGESVEARFHPGPSVGANTWAFQFRKVAKRKANTETVQSQVRVDRTLLATCSGKGWFAANPNGESGTTLIIGQRVEWFDVVITHLYGFAVVAPSYGETRGKQDTNKLHVFPFNVFEEKTKRVVERRNVLPLRSVLMLATQQRRNWDAAEFSKSVKRFDSAECVRLKRSYIEDISCPMVYKPEGGFLGSFALAMLIREVQSNASISSRSPSLYCTEFVPENGQDNSPFWTDVGEQAKSVRNIVLPANINQNHWVLIWLFGLPDNAKVVVFDSLMPTSTSGPSHVMQVQGQAADLIKVLKKTIGRNTMYSAYIPCPQQPDHTLCGIYMVQNFLQLLKNLHTIQDPFHQTFDVTRLASVLYKDINVGMGSSGTRTTMDSPGSVNRPDKPLPDDIVKGLQESLLRIVETAFRREDRRVS